MSRHLATTCLALCLSASAWGQWRSDPQENLAIADIVGAEQVQPQIVATADGSWWLSWFSLNPQSAPPRGYNVHLQRLSADGKEQFKHQGIEVAKLGVSSTEDYGLTTDPQGNALLTFQDDRYSPTERAITATQIGITGQPLWSTLTSASGHAPQITALPDGHSIVGWTTEDGPDAKTGVRLRKLDPMGQSVWRSADGDALDVLLAEPEHDYYLADLQAAGDGTVIVSFVHDQGSRGQRHLYANKISANGQLLWGANHVRVFDGGSLQMGNFPRFVLDGRGGAVFTWYSVAPNLQVHAQHVQAQGNTSFAHNGVVVSTDLKQARVAPSVSYQADTGEITLFWTELNNAVQQSERGLYAQKFDARGARQWGETGLPIRPLGSENVTDVVSLALADGTLAFWAQSAAGQQAGSIQAIKLDATGAPVCEQFAVSTRNSEKSGLAASLSPSGQTVLTWQDRAGNQRSDIYLQSVRTDCRLGG